MRKPVQEPPLFHVLNLQHHVLVAASARRRHNVLVKGKRDEANDHEQVHDGAHGAHALGQLAARVLAHVDALEAGANKGRAEPSDERVGSGVGQPAKGQRRDQRLAVALEGVGEHGHAHGREHEEAARLVVGERRGGPGGGGARGARHGLGVGVVVVVVVRSGGGGGYGSVFGRIVNCGTKVQCGISRQEMEKESSSGFRLESADVEKANTSSWKLVVSTRWGEGDGRRWMQTQG